MVSKKTGLPLPSAEKAVTSTFESITAALSSGRKVQFFGFGSFDVSQVGERNIYNPRTGKMTKSKSSKRVRFRPFKQLKTVINTK
jgi:nucleoid DNA-binding protein